MDLSKEAIATTARRLISESGPQALNARELGRLMGVSARPIYSHFASMDELRQAVFSTIVRDYAEVLVTGQGSGDRFLDVGLSQIRYGRDNPREYRLLYDQEGCNLGTTQALKNRTHGLATMVNQGVLIAWAQRQEQGENPS